MQLARLIFVRCRITNMSKRKVEPPQFGEDESLGYIGGGAVDDSPAPVEPASDNTYEDYSKEFDSGVSEVHYDDGNDTPPEKAFINEPAKTLGKVAVNEQTERCPYCTLHMVVPSPGGNPFLDRVCQSCKREFRGRPPRVGKSA